MSRPLIGIRERADAAPTEATFARLAWQYGPDRASLIMDGNDPKTRADLMAWRRLGTGSAA